MKLNKVYFCSGARNVDLLKILDKFNLEFNIDERVASFKALGATKLNRDPVAVCTTSGTAVAECVPAMLEAYYSHLPLILISADRPVKLHQTAAPQTLSHEEITRCCRRSFIEVKPHELEEINLSEQKYPLHINVIIDDTNEHSLKITHATGLEDFRQFLKKVHRPLYLISHEESQMRDFIQDFLKTGLPFYAEVLSGGHDLSVIKTEKKLLELFKNDVFDSVIRIGHTPLSKVWRLLEKKTLPVFHFDSRNYSALSYGEVLNMGSQSLQNQKSFWEMIKQNNHQFGPDQTTDLLNSLISKYPLSEISCMRLIQDSVPEQSLFYLGNSLVIRFFELVQNNHFRVFGNRGVNGIDGQLATAIGLAHSTQEIIWCILGDVTALYDLSSFTDLPKNLKLIIINNRGGRIFDVLKLDSRIILEHQNDFSKIAEATGNTYSQDLKDKDSVQIIELFPDLEQTHLFLSEWEK